MGEFLNTIKGQINSNFKDPIFDTGEDANGEAIEDLGYLNGYHIYSQSDKLIEEEKATNNTNNILNRGKKLTEINVSSEKTFPSKLSEDFVKGVTNNNDFDLYWEDPTYLGFKLRFMLTDSPLFNYSDDPYQDTSSNKNTAMRFLTEYSSIPEIGKRMGIYKEFLKEFLKIFKSLENTNQSGKKQYYIESILGLERMMAKHVKYEEDLLKVTVTEDVTLRALYLAELYNNLVYSYRTQSYVIPDNCLRFDMEIIVTDYRKFKITNRNFGENDKRKFVNISEDDTPKFIYKLRDCNFDFSESNIIQDELSMGGFGSLNMQPAGLSFNIKYKSVERIFKSMLIDESLSIKNKSALLYKEVGINNENFPNKTLDYTEPESEEIPKSPTNSVMKSFVKTESDKMYDTLKDTFYENTDRFIQDGFTELRKLRGSLINNITEQIRSFTGRELGLSGALPKIYPDNVYAEDFYDYSLDNFASGLFTDLYNDLENGFTDFGNNLGGF